MDVSSRRFVSRTVDPTAVALTAAVFVLGLVGLALWAPSPGLAVLGLLVVFGIGTRLMSSQRAARLQELHIGEQGFALGPVGAEPTDWTPWSEVERVTHSPRYGYLELELSRGRALRVPSVEQGAEAVALIEAHRA